MSAMQENVERWVNDTLHGEFESLCVSEGNESCNSSKLSAQQFDDDRRNTFWMSFSKTATDQLSMLRR